MTEVNEATPYDDVFRTEVIECPELIIPIINEAFCESYDGSETILQFENEIYLRKQDGYEGKRITDNSLHIKRECEKRGKSYHLECQSTADNSLAVRFPNSAILYLRSDKNTTDKITMVLETSGGSVRYLIPLIKLKKYELETIFKKRLFFLIPFWIFVHENKLNKYEENEEERKCLVQEFINITKRLQECCENGIIDEYTKCMLVDMSKKVIRNLLGNKFPKVREEVEKVFGGKVLEFEARTIKNQGKAEGRKEHLTECVCKKLRKGKDIKLIAEELEEEISVVEKICEIAKNYAQDYDVEAILRAEG